jgi:hypothetical protein
LETGVRDLESGVRVLETDVRDLESGVLSGITGIQRRDMGGYEAIIPGHTGIT